MNQPLVSIVIPCFNDDQFVEQAVLSAISQTYNPKEIILVDDGSNQKTKQVFKSLEPKIDLLITQENKGPSAARNLGISEAKGEYILVLDSDDYFEPEFCEKAISKLKADPDIKMVTCFAQWLRSEKKNQIFKPSGGKLDDYLLNNCALGSVIFKKKEWEKSGRYDEKMKLGFEDWEFYIRLHKNGGETYVIEEVLFSYRQKENSRTQNANLHKYELLNFIYIKHQELYKIYFELFVDDLLGKWRSEEIQNTRIRNKIEFQLGTTLLKPVRVIKSWFS